MADRQRVLLINTNISTLSCLTLSGSGFIIVHHKELNAGVIADITPYSIDWDIGITLVSSMQVLSVYREYFPSSLKPSEKSQQILTRSGRKLRVVVQGTIKHKGNLGYFEINLNLILVV